MDREIQAPLKAIELMEACYRAGLEFVDDGERLIVRPGELLTDVFRFQIKAHKPTILRILRSEQAIGIPCRVCRWQGITFDGWCEWCIDLVVAAEAVGEEIVMVKV